MCTAAKSHLSFHSIKQELIPAKRSDLLQAARESINHGLKHGCALPVDKENLRGILKEEIATFVTLKKKGDLRGCIGWLEAGRPLLHDVHENAYSAAFNDGRFSPLTQKELPEITIFISVLSHLETLEVDSEADLLNQLTPYQDGVVLHEGYQRGTFLPSVWHQLPTPKEFLNELKRKAGLSPRHWSRRIWFQRYQTLEFGEE